MLFFSSFPASFLFITFFPSSNFFLFSPFFPSSNFFLFSSFFPSSNFSLFSPFFPSSIVSPYFLSSDSVAIGSPRHSSRVTRETVFLVLIYLRTYQPAARELNQTPYLTLRFIHLVAEKRNFKNFTSPRDYLKPFF